MLDRHVVLGDFDDDARVRGREEEPPNKDGSAVPAQFTARYVEFRYADAIGIFTDAKWSGSCLVFAMSKPYQPLLG